MTVNVWVVEGRSLRPTAIESLPDLMKNDALVWVDITGPGDAGLKVMQDQFHFHPLAIEDTTNHKQRPKVEEYQDYLFFIAAPAEAGQCGVFRELDIFLGSNFVVTVHEAAEPIVEEAARRVQRNGHVTFSASYLFYTLVDATVDTYLPMLDTFEDLVETVEEQVIQRPGTETLSMLVDLKRTLRSMWRVILPQRDIFNLITRRDTPYIDHETLEYYLRDIYDHLIRNLDLLTTYREQLTGIEDLSMSATSNRLNVVVNRLTVITVVVGVVGAVSGFYGMNFEYIWPPHTEVWSVPVVIGIMLASIAGMILFFRRSGWF